MVKCDDRVCFIEEGEFYLVIYNCFGYFWINLIKILGCIVYK